MDPGASKFVLHCDNLNTRFTLTQEGASWQRSFNSFEDAYEHAESCATRKFPLILVNANGEAILVSSISPLASELAEARNRWRKLALAD